MSDTDVSGQTRLCVSLVFHDVEAWVADDVENVAELAPVLDVICAPWPRREPAWQVERWPNVLDSDQTYRWLLGRAKDGAQ